MRSDIIRVNNTKYNWGSRPVDLTKCLSGKTNRFGLRGCVVKDKKDHVEIINDEDIEATKTKCTTSVSNSS